MTVEVEAWMHLRGWTPADFQRRAWNEYLSGRSGLIHAPTGTGKSYSIWLGIVEEGLRERKLADEQLTNASPAEVVEVAQSKRKRAPRPPALPLAAPLRALWITPMRALANDLVAGLQRPIEELGLNWEIGLRTGDATAAMRRRQRERMPTALVTTPVSLSLLLSYPEARTWFADLKVVVVDEWHELIGTKRGVQTELGLARLRMFNPSLRTWGLSATLGNLEEARDVLLGSQAGEGVVVHGAQPKQIDVVTGAA
jgi:ATP-dependent Lhr-like helicase